MLKRVSMPLPETECLIRNAAFPEPFRSGLEFNAPARGPWNIVHTGMLLPESHQIFACARGCLRGVVLTAAEMNAMDRMSWIATTESEVVNGQMEKNIIEGTTDILQRLDKKPRAVLLFVSCIHLFAACDFQMVLKELRNRFPEVRFTDCYMHPTMRKSGLNPDQTMRKQLYSFLPSLPKKKNVLNILGNDRLTRGEMIPWLMQSGFEIRDIVSCKTFDEYLNMAEASCNLVWLPAAKAAGMDLEKRLGQELLYLPMSYDPEEIQNCYRQLAEALQIPIPDITAKKEQAQRSLEQTKQRIGNVPIVLDYTATPRPLNLAKVLLQAGFCVKKIYADAFLAEEKTDFDYLQKNYPDLEIAPTVHANMRFAAASDEKILAIGQKAAFFSRTPYFVNIVAGGGFYGFESIHQMGQWMMEAFQNPKDTEKIIQYKGWGCESCL